MRKEFLPKFLLILVNLLDNFFLKICPVLYMGLTRAQSSHDRFIFGSDIIKKFKKNDSISVLDVGCGAGNFYAYLKSFFLNSKYVGIDFNINHILSSKFSKKNFTLYNQDIRKTWFYGEFDFVLSSEVIEHIIDDNFFFQNLVKSTKKGGYIILTTPHYDSYINFANKFGWSKKASIVEDGGHVKLGYSDKEIEIFAKKFNLNLIDIFFITECDDFRAKNINKFNAGLNCYMFNALYFMRLVRYKRYVPISKVDNKLKYYCVGAVFQKNNSVQRP